MRSSNSCPIPGGSIRIGRVSLQRLRTVGVLVASLVLNYLLCSVWVPNVNGDSMFFLPQILNFKAGHGLTNPFYSLAYSYSPIGDGRQIWHGFLFQVAVAHLMSHADYESLFLTLRIIDGLTLAVMTVTLSTLPRKNTAQSKSFYSYLALSLLLANGFMLGLQGRPESMSLLIYALAGLAIKYGHLNFKSFLLGALSAANLLISPLQGVFSIFATVCFIYSQARTRQAFYQAVLNCAAAATLIIITGLSLFPYSVLELVDGIRRHAKNVIRPGESLGRLLLLNWRDLFVQTGHFFSIGLLILICLSMWQYISSRDKRFYCDNCIIILLCILFLVTGTWYFFLSGWYTFVALTPLVIYFSYLHLAGNDKKWIRNGTISIAAIMSLDVCLHISSHFYIHGRPTWIQARSKIMQSIGPNAELAISSKGYMMIDVATRNEILEYEKTAGVQVSTNEKYFIYVADWTTRSTPQYCNYSLISSDIGTMPATRTRSRLDQWFGSNGFAIAIYRRNVD